MDELTSAELDKELTQLHLSTENINLDAEENLSDYEFIDEEPRNVILGMLSQLKKGMDLHKVPFPTFVLEPRSMLERITDFVSHPNLIMK